MCLRYPLASSVTLLALTASAWGCQGAQRPAAPPEPSSSVDRPHPVASAHGADRAPAPPTKAEPEPSATPTPALESASETARLRAPGSTRSRIACGKARCEASKEQCISTDDDWRCVSVNQHQDSETQYACDEASDCARGEACCLSFASALDRYACTRRSGNDADCRLEVCVEGDGAPCPTGQVCKDGVCQAPARVATCEGGQRCPVDAPVCVFSGGAGRCASALEARATPHDGAYASLYCSKPSDCGVGARCCTNALWNGTACFTNCDTANNGQLCTSDRDCRGLALSAEQLRCLPAQGNEAASALPPWVRLCTGAR